MFFPSLTFLLLSPIFSHTAKCQEAAAPSLRTMKIAFVASSLALFISAVGAFAPANIENSAARHYSSKHTTSSSLKAVIDTNENANRDIAAMEEWAANTCGIQRAHGFQLTTEDGQDWSVMTTEPLPMNTPVLVVPSNVILSSSRAKQELAETTNIAEAVDHLTRLGAGAQVPLFYLVCKILLEYERGDQSPYYPWINALPRLYYNAVSMTDFCYECLPPLVFSLARAERVKVDNFHDALQEVNFLSQATKQNKELTKWAYNVVTTRCWGPDEDKQIVPMADMVRCCCLSVVMLPCAELCCVRVWGKETNTPFHCTHPYNKV